MALAKTSRRSHGPTIYILELTEAEARTVLDESSPDGGVHDALTRVLPLVEPAPETFAGDIEVDVDPGDDA